MPRNGPSVTILQGKKCNTCNKTHCHYPGMKNKTLVSRMNCLSAVCLSAKTGNLKTEKYNFPLYASRELTQMSGKWSLHLSSRAPVTMPPPPLFSCHSWLHPESGLLFVAWRYSTNHFRLNLFYPHLLQLFCTFYVLEQWWSIILLQVAYL